MINQMSRRHFLGQSALTLAGLSFAPHVFAQTATEQTAEDDYFLQVTVPNGWDVLLAMDPWIGPRPSSSEVFLDYREDEVQQVCSLKFGPALQPLKSYLSRVAVLNGIFVSKTSIDHVALRNYMNTGSGTGTKAATAIEAIAHVKAAGSWGLIADDAVPSRDYNIVKSSVESLKRLAQVDGPVAELSLPTTPLQLALHDYTKGLSLEETYRKNLLALQLTDADPKSLRAQITASAFKAKLSRSAALTIAPQSPLNSLDTHTHHEGHHLKSLTNVFEQIHQLLQTFARVELASGVSLLDRTTVYISSEFSRTPSLNNSQGKEHNAFTNSILLMGPRVRGGQTLGGSSLISRALSPQSESQHVAKYIDPETGRALVKVEELNKGILLKPETVVANVLTAAGVASSDLDQDLRKEKKLLPLFKA